MKRNPPAILLGGAILLAVIAGSPDPAMAQVDCETFPAGRARTDCYIGLGRINRQKSEIAGGVARQQADTATYRKVTGSRPGRRAQPAAPAQRWDQDWMLGWPR
jgi:hypothetical protein